MLLRRSGPSLLVLALLVAVAAVAGACASSAPPANVELPADCQYWCGSGSARVTIGGTTTTIAGGGCYDQGSDGVDVRFGDWEDDSDQLSYLALTAYRTGGPTPPPTPTAAPIPSGASPGQTEPPEYNVSGSVDGNPFILDVGASVTLDQAGKGAFSGIDIDGAGLIKGTFTCH